MAYQYTWVDSEPRCDPDQHNRHGMCDGCCDNGDCADCGGAVPDGARHWLCVDNGEVVHSSCDPAAASADWVDYY